MNSERACDSGRILALLVTLLLSSVSSAQASGGCGLQVSSGGTVNCGAEGEKTSQLCVGGGNPDDYCSQTSFKCSNGLTWYTANTVYDPDECGDDGGGAAVAGPSVPAGRILMAPVWIAATFGEKTVVAQAAFTLAALANILSIVRLSTNRPPATSVRGGLPSGTPLHVQLMYF